MKPTAGILIGALFASAQQPVAPAPDSPEPAAVFTVTSTLVQLDAVVTDSKGRHITDLAAEDFQVFEDGKPQKLTNFSYVRVTPEGQPPVLQASAPAASMKLASLLPPPPLAQLRREDVKRAIVLMVDDLGLSFRSIAFVRKSLRKFVNEQMQPGDLVAICQTGAGSGALQQFSADKRVLLSVIDGLRWNPNGRYGVAYFDPYAKGSSWENLLGSGEGDSAYDIRNGAIATSGTLGAINYIVGALRDVPGRKSIVLFSDGLQMFEAGTGPRIHKSGARGDQGAPDSYADVMRVLRLLIDRANRSGTVIYTMRATGAQTLQPDAEDNPAAPRRSAGPPNATPDGQAPTVPNGVRDLGDKAMQANLAYLADQTGGLAYENGNDLNWGLQRVLDDQAGYYLLGYRPAESSLRARSGKADFHRIQVKVTRPGLHVRSQSGFFGQTDEQMLPKFATPIEQLRATMLSPFRSAGVGLRLTALYREVPKRGPIVRNLLRINAADLSWMRDAEGGENARILLVVVATGAEDRTLTAVGRNYNVRVAPGRMQEAMRDGALCALDVPVPMRGAYQVRVAVRDEATAKIGSATQFLEIPNSKKGFALTSVVLLDGERSAAVPGPLDPTPALRQFKRGGTLQFLCGVQNSGRKGPGADLDTRVRVWRDGKEVYSAPARLVEIPGAGPAVFGAVQLTGGMAPGDYDLQVIATERSSKAKAAGQWTDFTILP
jgi:VWFA-related protein